MSGTLIKSADAIGIMPISSVTTGCHEPATGVAVHCIVVEVATILMQATYAKKTDLIQDERLTPEIVRVFPDILNPVIDETV